MRMVGQIRAFCIVAYQAAKHELSRCNIPGSTESSSSFGKGEKCRIKNQESKIDKHIDIFICTAFMQRCILLKKDWRLSGLSVGGRERINKFMGGYLLALVLILLLLLF